MCPVTPHDSIDAGSLCGLPLAGVVDPNAGQSWCSACSPSDAAQRGEGCVVGAIEGVQVLLRGGDRAVAESFLDDLEVGAASEQPGGVSVAQVVWAHVEG